MRKTIAPILMALITLGILPAHAVVASNSQQFTQCGDTAEIDLAVDTSAGVILNNGLGPYVAVVSGSQSSQSTTCVMISGIPTPGVLKWDGNNAAGSAPYGTQITLWNDSGWSSQQTYNSWNNGGWGFNVRYSGTGGIWVHASISAWYYGTCVPIIVPEGVVACSQEMYAQTDIYLGPNGSLVSGGGSGSLQEKRV